MILQKDPRYESGIWKKELEVFLEIKEKSRTWRHLQSMVLTNITDKYLATKIRISKKSCNYFILSVRTPFLYLKSKICISFAPSIGTSFEKPAVPLMYKNSIN